TTSMPGMFWIASRCLMPKAPWPASAIFMSSASLRSNLVRVFENEVTDRRVRGRHGVEAMHLLHRLVERAARRQPHHELDAFRARFADVVDMRDLGQRHRISDEFVEEAVVEFRIDEAGTGPLQLMRHAAGAEDHDAQILREAVDRLADRLAEHVAAMPGRRGILDHVDAQWD